MPLTKVRNRGEEVSKGSGEGDDEVVLGMLSERHPGREYLGGIRNMAWTLGGKPGLSVWMWVS